MPTRREHSPKISIIIPALNEEETLQAAIASCHASSRIELLVVDGGSTDNTKRVAREEGVILVESKPGRGVQLNHGARKSQAEILLFLHADTILPPGFCRDIVTTLELPGVVLGAFRLRTDLDLFSMRLVERIVNIRSRFLQMPYGDQALFIKRKHFFDLGEFSEISMMEDFEFVRRAKKKGRVRLADSHILTSGRRWRELGLWRTTLWNQLFILGFLVGISPESLASRKRSLKETNGKIKNSQ